MLDVGHISLIAHRHFPIIIKDVIIKHKLS